ncbi:MAG: TolB family protein [Dokdonella sp.]|uniref:TolB family protein n=1 Tax=Dokdonella sp. TaxID=2291710 RepID=UPI003F807FB8
MHRSIVVLVAAFAFGRAAYALDPIFADGFEFHDFPPDPIIDAGAPADSPTLFGVPGAPGGGPCLADPAVGTLFPNNWQRPRFTWIPAGGENLFELRLTAQNQAHALVVYTTASSWTMPANIWTALTQHTVDRAITVSVRGATYASGSLTSGPESGSTGAVRIAPVPASGAIVYWTGAPGGALTRGFRIGDETVKDIFGAADVSGGCFGCHAATPDGAFVGFSAGPGGGPGLALLSADGQHLTPSFISASAQTLMARPDQDAPSFSAQHWTSGDRIALTMYQSNIIWTDLEAASAAQGTGWGIVARAGETANAASASFAHTSDDIVYVSTPDPVALGVTVTNGDIRVVPYNDRAGGTPVTVVASADNEYYPAFSPDDHYIAYDRAPVGTSSYNNPQAEVYVSRASGGQPVRIAANDPVACTGQASPGVTNSWPRWSPATSDSSGRRYYWLTFSSTRRGGITQIYVAPVVDDGNALLTYPALYPWNQAPGDASHTPVWGDFAIPF